MPVDWSKYPPNWKDIRNEILIRAGGYMPDPRPGARCELCGIENYSAKVDYGRLGRDDIWCIQGGFGSRSEAESWGDVYTDEQDLVSIVVLTIMHMDHDTTNNDHSNLKAGCQQCHNGYDADFRKQNREATRKKRTGQLDLF